MRIVDLLVGRPRPTRVAAVYGSHESALEAARAALSEGDTDDEHISIVGPLEQLIGNEPPAAARGAWAVVVQPDNYPQCKRIVRALRNPTRRRRSDGAASAMAQSTSPAAAGLVPDRS